MKKLLPLLALYFSEGLPFGFQASALQLWLRERGVSLEAIGFAGLLSAPWLAKALWAPVVDRYGSARFGRRKSWIVPMQAALALCAFSAAEVERPEYLLALIFVMNLCAATMDIAVDALAVHWLEPRELGPGNVLQVVGYKLGMLTSGGLLVWATSEIGWYGLFNAMGALLVGLLVLTLFIREPVSSVDSVGPRAERIRFALIWARLRSAFRQASAAPLIAVVMTYKLGESLSDAMWKPLLFDRGFPAAQIGLWSGTFGMICSLAGSLVGGALARAIGIPAALLWIAAFRACGVGGQLWLSLTPHPTAAEVVAVTCIEDLFGGAITPVVFALMMRHTDRAIGGTHYTLLASLEVWGKLPLAALSGVLAAQLGYSAVFGLGTALCVAFAIMVRAIRARLST